MEERGKETLLEEVSDTKPQFETTEKIKSTINGKCVGQCKRLEQPLRKIAHKIEKLFNKGIKKIQQKMCLIKNMAIKEEQEEKDETYKKN